MFELVPLERHLFLAMLVFSLAGSAAGILQVAKEGISFRRLLVTIAAVQVLFAVIVLVNRAKSIEAFPITDTFESMLLLIVFMGISFVVLSFVLRQVWFGSVATWGLMILTVLAAVVAKPASPLMHIARTPWVIVHALSMSLSGAAIVFSAAMSVLFLWSRNRLRSNRFSGLFGKMPTVEKLEELNLTGLRLSFAILTIGFVSGIGLIAAKTEGLGMTLSDWLSDSKIVLIAVAWVLLLILLLSKRVLKFGGKTVAQATLFICFLILFAFIGSKIFCKSDHDFVLRPQIQNGQVE